MKILVTGARGMLGQDLTPVLAARHEVVAADLAECDITADLANDQVVFDVVPRAIPMVADDGIIRFPDV